MHEQLIWAEIDLDAIARNIRKLKLATKPPASLMAVVKADGYGHGAPMVARTALANGATSLGVARIDEGILLRTAGIAAPILVFGYTPPSRIPELLRYRLTPAVYSVEDARRMAEISAAREEEIPIHLKFDTGMGRVGLVADAISDPVTTVGSLAALPGIRLQGMFTHFATADQRDKAYTRTQLAAFSRLVEQLTAAGLRPPVVHAANSAALMELPESHFDMVRPGIALYGIYPSEEVCQNGIRLTPAMQVRSRILQVKKVPCGASVSYGATWTTRRPATIATIACGYADGYNRLLSNCGHVLINGHRAPVVGRICMDLTMVDVSDIPDVRQGGIATLFGRDQGKEILADELAKAVGTIPYEIVSSLTGRVPRYPLSTNQRLPAGPA